MSKLLIYSWGSLSEGPLKRAVEDEEIPFVVFAEQMKHYHADANFAEKLIQTIHAEDIGIVFSYDYFPLISMICDINRIPYVSWIYDCPQYTLYSKTLTGDYNYIFCFDRRLAVKLKQMGAVHCIHYPLAAEDMAEKITHLQERHRQKYQCELSFVGNLYNEKKNRLRQVKLSEYTAGYAEGLISAQLNVYGYNFIKDALNDEVSNEIAGKCNLTLGEEYFFDKEQLVADAIGMEVSGRERELVLKTVSEVCPVTLYTTSDLPKDLQKCAITVKPFADYETEVPLIFRDSKININITSKTIESGIAQRVFDILGCGGFCITNYQPEIAEFFADGQELVMYTDMKDLADKVKYYLMHEEERKQIAKNGYLAVRERFGLQARIKEMLETVYFGRSN